MKIEPKKQLDAILELQIRIYAQQVVNTELILDALSNGNKETRDSLSDEVRQNLVDANNQIRLMILGDYGYLDPNDLK